jgi:hypothetical protein
VAAGLSRSGPGILVAALLLGSALAACGTTPKPSAGASPEKSHAGHGEHPASAGATDDIPVRRVPLRAGERRTSVAIPQPYTPSAPTGVGTDDYRCFLLDPGLDQDAFVTGFNVLPDNGDIVHHVILFRVPPDQVAEAEAKDESQAGEGWTCFGTSGVGSHAGEIDDAPWLGAWAPGGKEQLYGNGLGEPFDRGSRIIMQVHYNLLGDVGPDRSAAELRWAPASRGLTPLLTRLVPAPVELPCRPGADGALCDRDAALADVKARFGAGPGALADLLHLLCGPVRPGPVQSCTRTVGHPETIRGVAGHMHLLGESIRIEVNPGKPDARTVLDIPQWDFDNQASRPVRPVHLEPFDTIRVTCRHSQRLRDLLPAFRGQPEKYVLWGEGTTDEMCLGILLVTRP